MYRATCKPGSPLWNNQWKPEFPDLFGRSTGQPDYCSKNSPSQEWISPYQNANKGDFCTESTKPRAELTNFCVPVPMEGYGDRTRSGGACPKPESRNNYDPPDLRRSNSRLFCQGSGRPDMVDLEDHCARIRREHCQCCNCKAERMHSCITNLQRFRQRNKLSDTMGPSNRRVPFPRSSQVKPDRSKAWNFSVKLEPPKYSISLREEEAQLEIMEEQMQREKALKLDYERRASSKPAKSRQSQSRTNSKKSNLDRQLKRGKTEPGNFKNDTKTVKNEPPKHPKTKIKLPNPQNEPQKSRNDPPAKSKQESRKSHSKTRDSKSRQQKPKVSKDTPINKNQQRSKSLPASKNTPKEPISKNPQQAPKKSRPSIKSKKVSDDKTAKDTRAKKSVQMRNAYNPRRVKYDQKRSVDDDSKNPRGSNAAKNDRKSKSKSTSKDKPRTSKADPRGSKGKAKLSTDNTKSNKKGSNDPDLKTHNRGINRSSDPSKDRNKMPSERWKDNDNNRGKMLSSDKPNGGNNSTGLKGKDQKPSSDPNKRISDPAKNVINRIVDPILVNRGRQAKTDNHYRESRSSSSSVVPHPLPKKLPNERDQRTGAPVTPVPNRQNAHTDLTSIHVKNKTNNASKNKGQPGVNGKIGKGQKGHHGQERDSDSGSYTSDENAKIPHASKAVPKQPPKSS